MFRKISGSFDIVILRFLSMSIDFVFGQFVVRCLSFGQFVVRFLLQFLDSSSSFGGCIGFRSSSSSVKSQIFVNRRKFVCGRCITILIDFYQFFFGQFVVRCELLCVNRRKFVCSRFIAIGAVSVWFTSSSVITDTWQESPERQPGQFFEPLTGESM